MRIIIYICFLGTLLLSVSYSFAQENDWEKMNLEGKVKSLIVDECLTTRLQNDINKICKIQRKYFFNTEGYIVKQQTFQFSQLVEQLNYTYEDNRLKSISSVNRDSSLRAIHTFLYDSEGNRIEENIINSDKSPNARYTYNYDEKNRKIEMVGYNMKTDSNQFIKETFQYDGYGNLIEETSENRTIKNTYKVNKDGIIEEKQVTITNNDKIQSKSTVYFTYDVKGYCIQELVLQENRKTETNYLYDEIGNWTSKRTIESKDRIISTEREIEYY